MGFQGYLDFSIDGRTYAIPVDVEAVDEAAADVHLQAVWDMLLTVLPAGVAGGAYLGDMPEVDDGA